MNFLPVVLGGTFDRFHKGHEHLLKTAASQSAPLIVGVTTNKMTAHKEYSELIEPYETRAAYITSWLSENRIPGEVVTLTNPYGPTIEGDFTALVVTPHTAAGADAINTKRQALGKPILPVKVADLIEDSSGRYISSTRIRAGEINRRGEVYRDLFKNDLVLNPTYLSDLKSPQGKLIENTASLSESDLSSFTKIALVGDSVLKLFQEKKLPFHSAVIDGHTRRSPVAIPAETTPIGKNPAGTISADVAAALATIPESSVPLLVEGEEDLLAFVYVLTMPLNSVVIYGQPGEGIVMIEVSENTKERLVRYVR